LAKNKSVVVQFDDELEKKLIKLGARTDDVLGKAMTAGAEAALPVVRECLKSAVGKGTKYKSRSTGELVASLGVSPAAVDGKGNTNVKIGFNEPRKHKSGSKEITNAFIANVIEHGKHGQPPRPWLKRAKSQSRSVFEKTAQEVIDKEVDNL
jgi:hypothetical protein